MPFRSFPSALLVLSRRSPFPPRAVVVFCVSPGAVSRLTRCRNCLCPSPACSICLTVGGHACALVLLRTVLDQLSASYAIPQFPVCIAGALAPQSLSSSGRRCLLRVSRGRISADSLSQLSLPVSRLFHLPHGGWTRLRFGAPTHRPRPTLGILCHSAVSRLHCWCSRAAVPFLLGPSLSSACLPGPYLG